jgi:sensor histidine kinase YesM
LGFIKIAIAEDGNLLKCTIEDNGVGRVAADLIRQNRRKEHKSRGSQITLQRLDLLNQMYKENFSIAYKDLYDSEGFASGTNVTITIPKDIKVYNNK